MFRKKNSSSSVTFNTLVGEGTVLDGNIKCRDAMRIDGTVNGNVQSDADILIGETAYIKGNVSGNTIYISGKIEGNIYSKSTIHFFSTARIYGDIEAYSIVTDEGAVFNGKCSILASDKEQSDMSTAKNKSYKNDTSIQVE